MNGLHELRRGCQAGTRAGDGQGPGIGRPGGTAWSGDNSIAIGERTFEGGAADEFVKRFGG